ncbi:MAG: hypothetical protein JNK15_24975, partial [Planctomycetes bacterium]|nr:hypothetical protein [Planctomycetota bacterium]
MSSARDRILGTLRTGLRGTRVPPLPDAGASAGVVPGERADKFAAVLAKIGGRVDRVRGLAAAAARVREVLLAAGA